MRFNESFISFLIRIMNSIGFFSIIPLLSIWFISYKQLDLTSASILIAAITFTGKAGGVITGPIIEKLGHRLSLQIGLLSCSIFISTMIFIRDFIPFFLVVCLFGLFTSLYNIALKVHISHLNEEERLDAFSMLNLAVNIGASIGPIIGGFIYDWNPKYIMLYSAMCYLIAFIISLFLRKSNLNTKKYGEDLDIKRNKLDSFKKLIIFLIFSSLFWFFYTQFINTMPLMLKKDFNSKIIASLFTLNSLTIICFQIIYTKYKNILNKISWYRLSILLLFTSFIILGVSHNIYLIGIAVILFSISEVIWVPNIDNDLILNNKGLPNAWLFGAAGVIWGLGEGLGSIIGLNLSKFIYGYEFLAIALMTLLFLILFETIKGDIK